MLRVPYLENEAAPLSCPLFQHAKSDDYLIPLKNMNKSLHSTLVNHISRHWQAPGCYP